MSARHLYQGRDGRLRIYDAASNFVEIPFVQMDLDVPIARQRPLDSITPTVGGYTHAPTGPDYDTAFYEPLTLNFSFWINNSIHGAIRDALCNPDFKSPWTVGGNTWSTTKGRGSIIMPDATYRPTQPFFDQKKVSVCFESLWTSRLSGSIIGFRWDEAYIPPQNISLKESADFVSLQISALIYGNVNPIANFSSGTSSV